MTMNDLFRREKFAYLPRAISKEGKRMHTYEVGDVAYWPPGPDVAIFHAASDYKFTCYRYLEQGKCRLSAHWWHSLLFPIVEL